MINLIQRQFKRHVFVHFQFATQIFLNHLWQIRWTFIAAKCTAAPHTTSDQLKRTCGNLFACLGHTNDHRLTPAFVTRLQRLAHGMHIANALERVVESTVKLFNQHIYNGFVKIFWIKTFRCSHFFCKFEFFWIQINSNNILCTSCLGALNHTGTDTAQAPHSHIGVLIVFDGVDCRTVASGDATAEQTRRAVIRFVTHHCHSDFRQHSVLRER
mmetsp:Transcript_9980/g.16770  ORF Transcript_9980/g.16770 Transcript_9980/m.16770 type:complete len:214 (-) Transcript_9980:481-1122(-)